MSWCVNEGFLCHFDHSESNHVYLVTSYTRSCCLMYNISKKITFIMFRLFKIHRASFYSKSQNDIPVIEFHPCFIDLV